MKKIILILTAIIMTSCATTADLTESLKGKMKNLGNNPCYDKATKTVKIGCNK